MSQKKATEKFEFEPTGPYRIQRQQGDIFVLIEDGFGVKRKALSQAKRYIENGNFTCVRVVDSNNHVIYERTQPVDEAITKDVRFKAMLRILMNSPKLPHTFNHRVCVMLATEFGDKINVGSKDQWTPEEDEALRILIGLGAPTNEFIGQALGRTESAVTHRVKRIDIPERPQMKRDKLF